MTNNDEHIQSTDNLSFAIWCIMQKVRIKSKKEIPRRGGRAKQYKYFFECTKEQWENLDVDWSNSESRLFDSTMKAEKTSFKNMG